MSEMTIMVRPSHRKSVIWKLFHLLSSREPLVRFFGGVTDVYFLQSGMHPNSCGVFKYLLDSSALHVWWQRGHERFLDVFVSKQMGPCHKERPHDSMLAFSSSHRFNFVCCFALRPRYGSEMSFTKKIENGKHWFAGKSGQYKWRMS